MKADTIAVQGAGLSIAACSFGETAEVINLSKFDRILDFDPSAMTLEAEAGISLAKIFEFLMPRGYWLPVQPGYPAISLGGCIAGNVHGKDHYRDGSFARWVVSLRLMHPDHGILSLSASDNPELFELTCGGFGLTGAILSAVVRVVPIPGNCVKIRNVPVASLAETFGVLKRLSDECDVLYGWNDLANFGSRLGSGYVVAGKITTIPEPPRPSRTRCSLNPHRRKLRLGLLNNATLPLVNKAYLALTRAGRKRTTSLYEALFPLVTKTVYFDSFGQRGVIESQVLVPLSNVSGYLTALEGILRRHRQPCAVAHFKLFRGEQRLLRFDGTGLCCALQFPNNAGTRRLLSELDAINIECRAITNLIKDSRLSEAVARAQYPHFGHFAGRLRAFDPRRRFSTALSERVGL